MLKQIRKTPRLVVALSLMLAIALPSVASALTSTTSTTLNQTVNAGALTTNIMQSDDQTPVASPAVSFPALNRSFLCQTSTATLGDSSDKLNVTNFYADAGWTLTIAATGGDSATWTSGGNSYSYNNSGGCTGGQLTIDASGATVTPDCNSACNSVTITKGTSTAFVSGSVSNATLMSAGSGTAWEGYMTGVSLSQKVPASQAAGTYSLPMTITVTSQ